MRQRGWSLSHRGSYAIAGALGILAVMAVVPVRAWDVTARPGMLDRRFVEADDEVRDRHDRFAQEVPGRDASGREAPARGALAEDELGASSRSGGRPNEAAEHFRRAARGWGAAGNLARQAASHHFAALSLVAAGSFAAARAEYELALAGFAQAGDPAKVAEAATNLATLLGRIGEYREAESRLRDAVASAESAGRPDLKQIAANSLANTLLFQGRHGEARAAYLYLLTELRRTGGSSSLEGSVLGNLASSFYRTGQTGDAIRYNQNSYDLALKTGSLEKQAVALNMRAILLDANGDLDGAVAAANESLAIRERIGDQAGAATTLANIGAFYGDKKYGRRTDLRLAVDAFIKAADIHRKFGNLEGLGSALNNAGATLTNLREYDRAADCLEEARGMFARIGNRSQLAEVLGNLGYNLIQQKKYLDAIPVYEDAARLFDNVRSSILDDAERISFFAGPANFYHTLVDLLMIVDRPQDAFVAAELGRSRALLDLIASARPAIEARIPAELRRRSAAERREALQADQRVREFAASGNVVQDPDGFRRAELGRDLTRASLARTEREIRSLIPDFDTLTAPRILDVHAVQQELLGPDEALIAYAPHGRRLQIFVLTRETFSARTEMIGSEALRAQVESFRNAIQAQQSVAAIGKRLYDLLLAPAEAVLAGKRTLYIVGDGPLSLLPFEALSMSADDVDPRYVLLSQPYDVVYAHSAAVLAELRATRRHAADLRTQAGAQDSRRPLLLFANPAYQTRGGSHEAVRFTPPTACARMEFGELKGTEREAAALIDMFNIDGSDPAVNMRGQAQVGRLRELPLQTFRYAHFAMHGVLCRGEGRNGWTESALAFAAADAESVGLLRLEDVYSLRFDADVVTLSACETALGQEVNGEGVLALTRAFLFSGADSTVSSLWRVSDEATRNLMIDFYKEMLSDGSTGMGRPSTTVRALQAAKRGMARGTALPVPSHDRGGTSRGAAPISEQHEISTASDTQHPFFWAGFILYGLPAASGHSTPVE